MATIKQLSDMTDRLLELLGERKEKPLAQATVTIQLAAVDGTTAVFAGTCFPPDGVRVGIGERIPLGVGANGWLFKTLLVIRVLGDVVFLGNPANSAYEIPIRVGQYLPIDISIS